MKTASEPLPSDPEKLQNIVLDLQARLVRKDAQIDHLSQQYQHILEQFRLAQQRQFGQSSEASLDQLGLFNDSRHRLTPLLPAPVLGGFSLPPIVHFSHPW